MILNLFTKLFDKADVEVIVSPLTKESIVVFAHRHQKEHCKVVDGFANMKVGNPIATVLPLIAKLNSLNHRIEVLHNHSIDHRDVDLVSYNASLLWDIDELEYHSAELKMHLDNISHTLMLGLVEIGLCPDLTFTQAKKIRHLIRIAASMVNLLDTVAQHKAVANEGKRTDATSVHLKAIRSDELGKTRVIPRQVRNQMLSSNVSKLPFKG